MFTYLEDHPRYRKSLGSPPCIGHLMEGVPQPYLEDLLTMVINHIPVMGWSSK